MAFELPQLDYNHDALEPHIDARTMEIHHGKHHAGYTAKLNAAIEGTDKENKSIKELMLTMDMSNGALRNNGGGYFNHCLFWKECHQMVEEILLGRWLKQLIETLGHLKTSKMHFQMLQLNLVPVGLGYVYMMEEN